jgi:hypothetical protein
MLGWLKIKSASGTGANNSAINIVAFINVIQQNKNLKKKTSFEFCF